MRSRWLPSVFTRLHPRAGLIGSGTTALVVGLLCAAGLAAPAKASVATKPLGGPDRVQPGEKVTFRAVDLSPSAPLFVYVGLARARESNCCSVSIEGGPFRTDATGEAMIRFRFPRRYAESYCAKPSECVWHRWKPGERVDVNVCVSGEFQHCARRTIRIKGRNRRGPQPIVIPATARKAIFRAACRQSRRCGARVTFKAGSVTLARGGYSIPPRSSRKVGIGLTAAGRDAIAASRQVRAKLKIVDARSGRREVLPVILRRRR